MPLTPREIHKQQRRMVTQAMSLEDTPEDRHGVYARRRPPAIIAVVTQLAPVTIEEDTDFLGCYCDVAPTDSARRWIEAG